MALRHQTRGYVSYSNIITVKKAVIMTANLKEAKNKSKYQG